MLQRLWISSLLALVAASGALAQTNASAAAPSGSTCSITPTTYMGWQAQELTSSNLILTIVPQLGGRLMQVSFNGHPYLFVNPRFAGQYISPADAKGDWINYGGDKVWPMPEGNQDEHHWVLASTAIDDLPYAFRTVSQGPRCTVELTGQPDTITGLQYVRTISVVAGSNEIGFHTVMRNSSAHPIAWSVQSVTQYDLSDASHTGDFNHAFYAYAPISPVSTYPGGYHVRSGLADDPSFSVQDGLFQLHWLPFANEVWLDSASGWITIVDQASGYGMVERFTPERQSLYPDHASVIFYKNGPSVRFDRDGHATVPAPDPDAAPHYMEAELNSPLVNLNPGATYAWETRWNPVRIDRAPILFTSAGLVTEPFTAARADTSLLLSGRFSVFHSGQLMAVLLDEHSAETARTSLGAVTPETQVSLAGSKVAAPLSTRTLTLHLVGPAGEDFGILATTTLTGSGR